MDMMTNPAVQPYLDALRSLPFIQELDFSEQHGKPDLGIDGILTLSDPSRDTCLFRPTEAILFG
jgi:hypothetical protein